MRSFGKMLVRVVLMLSGSHYLYVVEPDREFIKKQDGIRLYRRDVPGTEIDEFKGETVMSARIEVIGMALRDGLAYPKWMPDCKHTISSSLARILEDFNLPLIGF